MHVTNARHPGDRPVDRRRRLGPKLLAVAGLATVLLAGACDTSQQVPWDTYNSQLQARIDIAVTSGDCATLQALRTQAKATSGAHEKATGFPNDALVSYIQAAQHRANCPAGNG
jgi:hypothetical protein